MYKDISLLKHPLDTIVRIGPIPYRHSFVDGSLEIPLEICGVILLRASSAMQARPYACVAIPQTRNEFVIY